MDISIKLSKKKPEDKGLSFDQLEGYCETEFLIANAIIKQEVSSIESVCQTFNLSREQAVTILNSRSFLKLLDKLSRFRKITALAEGIDVLAGVLRNGNNKERLAAFDLIQKLIEG